MSDNKDDANTNKISPTAKIAGFQPIDPRFIFVGGDKGGVGKSFTSLTIADYFGGRGEQLAIIDSDTSNSDFASMFKGPFPCKQVNLSLDDGWMDILDHVKEYSNRTIIMDTPGGVRSDLKHGFLLLGSYLAEQKPPMKMELWWTMGLERYSITLLDEIYKDYGHLFSSVRVICNMHWTDNQPEGYADWRNSDTKIKLEKKGATTIYLPGLHARVKKCLFKDPNFLQPFYNSVDDECKADTGLSESEHYKLKFWRNSVGELFSAALGVSAMRREAAIRV
jgi:hypothetical protein